jgi:protocatechuate 3,4-dioxygenase beta subunit
LTAPRGTTTTDSAGHYLFNGLQPDSYFVHIPGENFAAAATRSICT